MCVICVVILEARVIYGVCCYAVVFVCYDLCFEY